MAGLTFLDFALIAAALVSGLLAMYRGFVREVLSILSWIIALAGAAFVALKHKDFASNLFTNYIADPNINLLITALLVFFLILIIVHIFTSRISDAILDSQVGAIDRTLGFIFGAARGFLLILILFLIASFFMSKDSFPPGVANAKSLPYFEKASSYIKTGLEKISPSLVEHLKPKKDTEVPTLKEGRNLQEQIRTAAQKLRESRSLPTP